MQYTSSLAPAFSSSDLQRQILLFVVVASCEGDVHIAKQYTYRKKTFLGSLILNVFLLSCELLYLKFQNEYLNFAIGSLIL